MNPGSEPPESKFSDTPRFETQREGHLNAHLLNAHRVPGTMLSTEELKETLLAPAPDSSQNAGSSLSSGLSLPTQHSGPPAKAACMHPTPAKAACEPRGAAWSLEERQAGPATSPWCWPGWFSTTINPQGTREIPNFLPPLSASSSSRLPLRSEPRRNLQESTAFASKQASCSLVAQPTRKDLNLSACHSPNYSLCLESNNNRASFMSSSHHEPWGLMHTAKYWEVLKGQGVCAASSPRPLGENPSHSPVQTPAPEKQPEASSASRAYFLGLAWVTVGGAPRRASRSESSCTQATKGRKGVEGRRLKMFPPGSHFSKCSQGYTILQRSGFQ